MLKIIIPLITAIAMATPSLAQSVPEPSLAGQPQQALVQSDIETWLDGIVPYALKSGDLAGAVVTVVADGQVVALNGYGQADIEAGRPVDPETTLFRAGSVSKLVTWTAVMQQVELGVLDLDADINTYLDFAIPLFDGQPITVRQIMTHTAGFEEQLKHVLSYDPAQQLAFGELVRTHVPARIFQPGTTPAYSNYATALAGYIVERVSGEPFEDYVDRHIFEPLGMENATFSQQLSEQQLADLSVGYDKANGTAIPFELVSAVPAGAMSATAPDMARFMLAHLGDGRLGDAQILQPGTAQLMHRQSLATIPALNGIALGFYESSINGHRVISHGGDTTVFHSDLHLFIDDDVGLFISINSTGENGAAHKLRALLFSEFADRYFPAAPAAPPQDIGSGNARLLEGQWISSRRTSTSFLSLAELLSQTTIATDPEGKLVQTNLPILGAPVQEWIEVEPFVWQASNSHERLSASIVDGAPAYLSLDSVAPIMVFEPVPWQRAASWLLPTLLASVAALALTGLQWPAAALVRRHYGQRAPLRGAALVAYRGVRATALLVVGLLASWFVLVIAMFTDLTLLGSSTDAMLQTLQGLTIAGMLGLGAMAAANAVYAFHDNRTLWSKIWAVVLIAATATVVWVAFVFNLFKLGVMY